MGGGSKVLFKFFKRLYFLRSVLGSQLNQEKGTQVGGGSRFLFKNKGDERGKTTKCNAWFFTRSWIQNAFWKPEQL